MTSSNTLQTIKAAINDSSLEESLRTSLVEVIDQLGDNPPAEAVEALSVVLDYLADLFTEQSILDSIEALRLSEEAQDS